MNASIKTAHACFFCRLNKRIVSAGEGLLGIGKVRVVFEKLVENRGSRGRNNTMPAWIFGERRGLDIRFPVLIYIGVDKSDWANGIAAELFLPATDKPVRHGN